MNNEPEQDPVWQAAWSWIRREHERVTFDADARAELDAWLRADPGHRATYDKAAHLWRLAGMLPPVHDLDAGEPSPLTPRPPRTPRPH